MRGGRKASHGPPREPVPNSPPRLPALYNGSQPLQTFGDDARPDSVAIVSGKADHSFHHYPPRASIDPGRPSMSSSIARPPVPPVPNGGWVDPYARTESMTNRGRYSYASSAISTINSPRRVRRRKDPTPFNILVIGTRGSGKTSFLEFLKTSLALPAKKRSQRSTEIEQEVTSQATPSGNFIPHYLESEIDGERVGLTIWDSEGLEKNVVDLQLREMSTFLEGKFEETFAEEMKVVRSPGVQDTHIHAAFLILDPARLDRNIAAARAVPGVTLSGARDIDVTRLVGGLDEDLDLQVMRTLHGKTTVIPVISKADTVTTAHMTFLKKTVWASLKKASFDPLAALGLDEEDGSTSESSKLDENDELRAEAEAVAEAEADEEAVGSDGDEEKGKDSSSDGDDNVVEGEDRASYASKRRSAASTGQTKTSSEGNSEELPLLPMSIISPDLYEPGAIDRKFPWGTANPYDPDHCDFTRLRDAVFTEWRSELREASREQWYEGWRTSRLKYRDPANRRR
ncbi:putative septin aspe protein [Rosellinia necatrix]|uniref:Putative septin aspe protein n=1 Tax=Rosellinia necatrix TaxID=77044 RepID=A0A1W2TV54_ROSNE|nr:putative septin aspe protein [Rosellinia necatrix]